MDDSLQPTHIVQVRTDNAETEYVYDSTSTSLEPNVTCLLVTNANTGQQQLLQLPADPTGADQNMLLVVNPDVQNDTIVYNQELDQEDHEEESYEENCSENQDEVEKLEDKTTVIENSDHNQDWYKSVYCRKCQEMFPTPIQLQEHNLSKHRNLFTCGICFYGFKTARLLRQHVVVHDEKQFKCQLCSNKYFCRKETLDRHMKHYHNSAQICYICHKIKEPQHTCFSCKTCQSKFKTQNSYDSHKCLNETKYYVCPYCQMTFTRHTGLLDHMLSQEDRRKFKCSQCKAMFNTKSQLRRHERKHDPASWIKCEQCGKKYATASGFRLHNVRKHNGHIPSGKIRQPLECKKYEIIKHPTFKEQSVQATKKSKSRTKSCQTSVSPVETEILERNGTFRTSPSSPSPESSACSSPLPVDFNSLVTESTATSLDEVSKILECDEDVIIENESYQFNNTTIEILDQGIV